MPGPGQEQSRPRLQTLPKTPGLLLPCHAVAPYGGRWDGRPTPQSGAEHRCPSKGRRISIIFSKTCSKLGVTAGGDKYARQSQRYFSSTNPRISQADAGERGSKVGWESYMAMTRCCRELQSWFMPVQWACLAVLLETQLQTPELFKVMPR